MNDYRKLDRQPLRFALAEFRFSTVMDIQAYIPKLQEELRRQYPIPDKKTEQRVRIEPGGIATSMLEQWSFVSSNRKSAIGINQDRLIYYTAEYPRFKGFSNACEFALSVLESIVEPSLILRIGLRYGDLVIIEDGEKATDFVDPHFTFPDCASQLGNTQHQRSETYISTKLGGLAIRTLYGVHSLSCLPDIEDLPIAIDVNEEPSERIVLDFDHFWEPKGESTDFETSKVLLTLESLHDTSRAAFWKVTTDYARNEKWA